MYICMCCVSSMCVAIAICESTYTMHVCIMCCVCLSISSECGRPGGP